MKSLLYRIPVCIFYTLLFLWYFRRIHVTVFDIFPAMTSLNAVDRSYLQIFHTSPQQVRLRAARVFCYISRFSAFCGIDEQSGSAPGHKREFINTLSVDSDFPLDSKLRAERPRTDQRFTNSTHLVSELLQSAVPKPRLSLHKDLAGLASSFRLDFLNDKNDILL